MAVATCDLPWLHLDAALQHVLELWSLLRPEAYLLQYVYVGNESSNN